MPSLASTNYMDYNTGKLTIVNDSVGGSANPLLVLQNTNTTAGAVTFETYKNDLPTSTGGDAIASWSATCNTNIGKTEIARINQIAYGVGSVNNDGGISLACKVNSAITNFLICNGGSGSGEIQIFKPITNPTGNIELNATSSSGTGTITIESKLQAPTSSNDMIFTNNLITTLSHSNDNGWNFVGNKITTTSNVDCTNLILTNNPTSLGVGTTWNIDCLNLSTGYFRATPALAGAITIASLTNTRIGGRYIVSIISVSGTASLTRPVGYYSNFGASFNLFPIADRFELEIIINYGGSFLLNMTRFTT